MKGIKITQKVKKNPNTAADHTSFVKVIVPEISSPTAIPPRKIQDNIYRAKFSGMAKSDEPNFLFC